MATTLPGGRPHIVITRRLPEPVEQRARALFDVSLNVDDEPCSVARLHAALDSADGLIATVTDRLDRDALLSAPRRARIVANFGVGFNHIDIAAAGEAGIVVTNTPGVLTDDTADLAMTLMLMVARRAGEGERLVRAGAWTGWGPTQLLGTRLTGATLGIVGMGRIGQAVARRARHGFGMTVLSYQPNPLASDQGDATPCGSLGELLERSDVVSLHCPATPETRHLIDANALARMGPQSILINTSRGDVIDEAALAVALGCGQIRGAGLDVYEEEPQVHPALRDLDNVVLLPHLGSATDASRIAMGMCALDNLEAYFAGDEPPNRVV
jgi:lactate dehydrogenase-like 2-hydroxyacid dehydrogenase